MHSALAIKTPPTAEPRTTAEAKAHLRVTGTDEDTYIDALVAGARQAVENYTGRALITQTWTYYLDAFPDWTIEVPLPPLQSIASIKYTDTDGVLQTVDAADYIVDAVSARGRITPAFGKVWPTPRGIINAVQIELVAGYGNAASDVPMAIRQALDLIYGAWFEHRENLVVGASAMELPDGAKALLAPYVSHRFQ